ncbi:hypothetical protein [Xanthomonas sp. NCPPB 2632]|uniref:hypothetical protein n=1 Tax=Xanthomonas sp. NCPPB 2632 TaxID=3240912 RepID=UPI0035188D89
MKNLRELAARNARKLGAAGAIAATAVSGSAMAAGTDFSSVTSGVDNSTLITGLVAMAVVLVGAGFAKWGSKKIGGFFG